MYRVCKTFYFEAAHILDKAHSKCCTASIHGHSYKVEVVFEAQDLIDGMVIDFGLIKQKLGTWIEQTFDHRVIFGPGKKDLAKRLSQMMRQPLLMNESPTAENMAGMIYDKASDLFYEDARVILVRVWETSDSWAEYSRN